MNEQWKMTFQEIENLNKVTVPRCMKPRDDGKQPELHVFADASEKAYGAVAYMVWPTTSEASVNFVTAKSRVAPLHQTSIPRLELLAALIASRLATTVVKELRMKPSKVYLWSDSKIVLKWIKSESWKFKQFVGIRVAEIQSAWDSGHWNYVPTEVNPADDLSRGISVNKLSQWHQGPEFLKSPDKWPKFLDEEFQGSSSESKEYRKAKVLCMIRYTEPLFEASKFSSWIKLVRVTAFCLRFIYNLRHNPTERKSNALLKEEMDEAEMYWIKQAQLNIDVNKQYSDLSPFVKNDVIRVGGRLRHSPLEYDSRHPYLVPADHPVALLLMRAAHDKVGHAGHERTLARSRRNYWIIKGRRLAKSVVRSCVVCRKMRKQPHSTLMGDLPKERLMAFSPPFTVTGADLFGPFSLKISRNKTIKAWGVIFTCASTRASHLEIVEDLSTCAFLQALRRFAARRGWPQTIITDNGKNFIGTERELRRFLKEGQSQLKEFVSTHKVKWLFTTPLSPHQGGIYESLIKQVKITLKRVIGSQILTWNEISTIFAETENLINSRPLGYTHSDPNELQPLTPNHFLIGRSTTEVPQGPFTTSKDPRKRFEFVQALVNQVWKRFIREYIPTLIQRNKWKVRGRQLSVNDIVLLVDFNAPRGQWSLGRVIEVYPGSDGIVRNVRVCTSSGEYKRSIQKCCLILEADE